MLKYRDYTRRATQRAGQESTFWLNLTPFKGYTNCTRSLLVQRGTQWAPPLIKHTSSQFVNTVYESQGASQIHGSSLDPSPMSENSRLPTRVCPTEAYNPLWAEGLAWAGFHLSLPSAHPLPTPFQSSVHKHAHLLPSSRLPHKLFSV